MRLSLTPMCAAWRRCAAPSGPAPGWRIPDDFEVRASAYDAGRARTTSIRVLSGCDLNQQVKSDGATWLDRRLVGRDKRPLFTAASSPPNGVLPSRLLERARSRGRLVGSTQLANGRFAMIDDGLGFRLVPWRPILEKMRGEGVSWQFGGGRTLGIGI